MGRMRRRPSTHWSGWSNGTSMSIQRPERIFTGTVASPGIVAGRLRLHARRRASQIAAGSPVEEALRLDRALSAAAARLDQLNRTVDKAARGILEFQIALIEDDELVEPVRRAIAGGAPAPQAWRRSLDGQIAEYEAAPDAHFRARAADIADLRDRVFDLLTGAREARGDAQAGGESHIYVAED